MREASAVPDQEYFAWIETPGNKPGDDCKYPDFRSAWRACHQDLGISGDWENGIGHFLGVVARWLQSNPFGNE